MTKQSDLKSLVGPKLSEKDYLIECQKRNPDFILAQRDLEKRRRTLFPDENIRLSECNAQQKAWVNDFINSWWHRPGPLLLESHDHPYSRSKVCLVADTPDSWPRDGSILIRVHPTATGDEVKRAYEKIKKHFFSKRVRPDNWRLKLEIYDLYFSDRRRTLKEIAKIVKKPIATVAHLLAGACRDIGHLKQRHPREVDPSFDFEAHFSGCSSCLSGRLCPLAEEKAGIKDHNLKELLPYKGDIVDAERRQYRKKTGLKPPLVSSEED
jgi:hypothetical protein